MTHEDEAEPAYPVGDAVLTHDELQALADREAREMAGASSAEEVFRRMDAGEFRGTLIEAEFSMLRTMLSRAPSIKVSAEAMAKIQELIDNPPPPTPALRALMARHRKENPDTPDEASAKDRVRRLLDKARLDNAQETALSNPSNREVLRRLGESDGEDEE